MIGKVDIIESDLFDISSRIKGIDEKYFIVYSYAKKRYEVHYKGQRGNSLAFVVPYNKLDCRTLIHAMRTRRERIAELIAETEAENEKLNKTKREEVSQKVLGRIDDTLRSL